MLATPLIGSLTAPLLMASVTPTVAIPQSICSPEKFLMPTLLHWANRPSYNTSSLDYISRFSQARLFVDAAAELPYLDATQVAPLQRQIEGIREQLYDDCVDAVLEAPLACGSDQPLINSACHLLNLIHLKREGGARIEDTFLTMYQGEHRLKLTLPSARRKINAFIEEFASAPLVKTVAHEDPQLFASIDLHPNILHMEICRLGTHDYPCPVSSSGMVAGLPFMGMPSMKWLAWEMITSAAKNLFRKRVVQTSAPTPSSKLADKLGYLSLNSTRVLHLPPQVKEVFDPTHRDLEGMMTLMRSKENGVVLSESPSTILSAIEYLVAHPKLVRDIQYGRVPLSAQQLNERNIPPPAISRNAMTSTPSESDSGLSYGRRQWAYPLVFKRA